MGSNPLAPLTEVLRAYNESDLLLLPRLRPFGPMRKRFWLLLSLRAGRCNRSRGTGTS